MYHKLKYLYYLPVFAACLLSSCNSDVPGSEDVDMGAEMSFVTDQPSRAIITSFDKFAVYGDMKWTVDNSDPILVFAKTEVSFQNGSWTYDGTQYWFPDHEHSFVAVTPVTVLDNDPTSRYSASKLSFTYSLPSTDVVNNDDLADILVATHRRLYKEKEDGLTTLKFRHIMSMVNFAPSFVDNVLSNDDYILFHRLELSGVNTKARFDIVPPPRLSNSQTDDMVFDVTPQSPGNRTIIFKTPVMVINHAESVSLFGPDDSLIMIPQTFTADADAKINFFYSINEETTIRQASLPLNNIKWESGNSYIYKFTIERSGLILDKCEINTWNTITGDDIIVD